MLDRDTRQTILILSRRGHGIRAIARGLKLSRNAVRRVLKSGVADIDGLRRTEQAEAHLDTIRELHQLCAGNLVRVHEELLAKDISLPYSTLTRLCRRHDIGRKPKRPAGRYHFEPGQEMQHDTSPHKVTVGGKLRGLQCASLVLCYSRMIYAQCFPRFTRFWCKSFLTDAVVYFGGAADKCMVDNTAVVVVSGSGPDAVFAAEMVAIAERFGFDFVAHEPGDANRSARVERPFHYIENNFYPGRSFDDLNDLNRQFVQWCDRVNARYKKHLRAKPIELFATEKPALKPLPMHVPEVYEPLIRIVDVEGFVTVSRNRYSVPTVLISRQLQIKLTKSHVRIFDGRRLIAEHERAEDLAGVRRTLPEHRRERRWHHSRPLPELPEEKTLRAASPVLGQLVDLLKARYRGRAVRQLRRLHAMYLDYPTEPLVAAVDKALSFGLLDLKRIEKVVLQTIAGDYFRLPVPDPPDEGGDDNG